MISSILYCSVMVGKLKYFIDLFSSKRLKLNSKRKTNKSCKLFQYI